jgi:hypothetical protein
MHPRASACLHLLYRAKQLFANVALLASRLRGSFSVIFDIYCLSNFLQNLVWYTYPVFASVAAGLTSERERPHRQQGDCRGTEP